MSQDQFENANYPPKREKILLVILAIATFGSGLLNLYSLVNPIASDRIRLISDIFPVEFRHFSRFMTLMIGFGLVISSINLYRRKKRAFFSVLLLSIFSIVFHLTKGLNYEEAAASFMILILLVVDRKNFTVRSSIISIPSSLLRIAVMIVLTLAYGSSGFWFIEKHHFGINFHWQDALSESFRYLLLIGDPDLVPLTRHARWFIDSLYLSTIAVIAFVMSSLYRPIMYKFRIKPRETDLARQIIQAHGRSSQDFFKYWPDKSFFFSANQQSVISYGVSGSFAIVLGDPVGPEQEIKPAIIDFKEFCDNNGWGFALHQTLPDFLPVYEDLGFKKLKVGDDAIVDLTGFSIEKIKKQIRHTFRKVEETGIEANSFDPPHDDALLDRLKEVSDEWLKISGRRERGFTLGEFKHEYVRSTEVFAAMDKDGRIQGFVNLIPSYKKGEATHDLMRRRRDAPNGIMDYIFVKLFLYLQSKGFERFNMGMAPMSGFRETENPSLEEKAIHYFFQHLNFLFSYRGLLSYKAKFATIWEPRYAVYRNPLDLPKLAIALRKISEIKPYRRERKMAALSEANRAEEILDG